MNPKPKILVVDDIEKNARLLEAMLVPKGYDVTLAFAGKEAVDQALNKKFDVILLDVMMPDMDGFQVTKYLREQQNTRLIPIVLITALKETEDRIKGIKAGCDDFISKPFDIEEVVARVSTLIEMNQYRASIVAKKDELLDQANKRITQSEKMAAVGEISASITHQVKNPLTTILMAADSLASNPGLDEKGKTAVGIIKNAAEKASQVIFELLRFSRFSDDKIRPINLTHVLHAVTVLLEDYAKEKGARIETINQNDQDVIVLGDHTLLEQVFLNLATNAIDSIADGGKITITAKTIDHSKRHVVVTFADNGTGIPPDILKHIWEPFFTTKAEGRGTGLGLSLVKSIIQKLNARIEVENAEDGGAVFTITLPVPPE